MVAASILLDKDFAIGPTDPRLFGAFVEHLGRIDNRSNCCLCRGSSETEIRHFDDAFGAVKIV